MTILAPGWRSFTTAVVAAFVASVVLDLLINAVLLRETFDATRSSFRPSEELNRLVPWAWLAMLASIAFHAALFARLGLHGIAQGLEFGLWLGLGALVSGFAMASLVPWPLQLVAGMAVQQFLTQLVTGLCLGWLYRPLP